MNAPDPRAAGLLVIGKDVQRTDAIPKVTGAALYVADIQMPGMLHGAVLRSPHPNARIVSIDLTAARAMPGVKSVITGDDTAHKKWGAFRPDLYPLAIGRVRYVGDEVAAVAANTPEIARAAIDKIIVKYEVLPAVLSMDEAMAANAPLVHDDCAGNIAHEFNFASRRATSPSKARGNRSASGTPRWRPSAAWRNFPMGVTPSGATRKRRIWRAGATRWRWVFLNRKCA
jgi:CO/xanthine dehydrogenase Mo-binding subunit